MIVRPAAPADAPEVARVHVRSWQVAYRGLLPDAYLDALRPEERAARYTFGSADPRQPATIVAVEEGAGDGAIRGFATTGPSRDGAPAGELLSLNVEPGFWSRGIGSSLLAAAEQRLRQDGHARAVLWVLDGNERAMRFYRAHGWSPDGTRRAETLWGVPVVDWRYVRALP
jgi:GNAT superfamily N-acetyltransferase